MLRLVCVAVLFAVATTALDREAFCAANPEHPNCHYEFAAVVDQVQNPTKTSVNCSFIHLTRDGTRQWVKQNLQICNDIVPGRSNGIPRSAYLQAVTTFYWVSGQGAYIWTFSVRDGVLAKRAELPTRYNFTIGMAKVPGQLLLVTTDGVYSSKDDQIGAPVTQVGFLSLYRISRNAVLASSPSSPYLFIADGGALFLYEIATGDVTSFLVPPLSQIVDLQWYDPYQKLIVVDNNVLYLVTPSPEAPPPEKIWTLPPGPGFARVNTVADPEWFFIENSKLYIFDVKKKSSTGSFNFADEKRMQGYFQYFQ